MTNSIRQRPRTHHDIDEAAISVASQALAGGISESDARWALAASVYQSDIPERVVRQATSGKGTPTQVVADSTDYVREQLTKMIVGPNPKLDMARLAQGASLCGWAARVISGPMVFPKVNYDSRKRQTRTVTVSDETISGLLTMRSAYHAGITPIVSLDDERFHDVVDEYLILAKGLREWELTHLNAEHICVVSEVAAPRRAVLAPNRKALLRRVESEETSTRDDLRAGLSGNAAANSLYDLFSHLDPAQVEAVARLNPLASQTLSRSALTPVPAPRHTILRTVTSSLAPVVGGKAVAKDLVAAYANVVSEVDGSEFTPSNTLPAIKSRRRRTQDFANWQSVSMSVAENGYIELGETPESILTSLSSRVRSAAIARAINSRIPSAC